MNKQPPNLRACIACEDCKYFTPNPDFMLMNGICDKYNFKVFELQICDDFEERMIE